jgi:hypothetical protein
VRWWIIHTVLAIRRIEHGLTLQQTGCCGVMNKMASNGL